ncbi:MAG: hypothetical protein IJM34_09175 [Lachnospiraceae bacterium]|nr:hypothetical protein [Lachnospiraceae bacterium]
MGKNQQHISPNEEALLEGLEIIKESPLFSRLYGEMLICKKDKLQKASAIADASGHIILNKDVTHDPQEWAFLIAHCQLHFAFGHFDADKVPAVERIGDNGKISRQIQFDKMIWNVACDIYITRFLEEIKFGRNPLNDTTVFSQLGKDENSIYQQLMERGAPEGCWWGTSIAGQPDMRGIDEPRTYENIYRWNRRPTEIFAGALAYSVSAAVSTAGGHNPDAVNKKGRGARAAEWFINHYPLLGGMAAGFKIIEDAELCRKEEISVAAVDAVSGEIYINPAARLNEEELKFVLAHEYLHAGLGHHTRCNGMDKYLWNVACDYVINGWLNELHVGSMPQDGLLYDAELKGMSAEEIYDRIVTDLRKYRKLATFRGNGMGDVIGDGERISAGKAMDLDEFCRRAMQQGLEYHLKYGRGTVPAGLVQEIRALAMPPIPWDVELGRWFDAHFLPLEAKRTYARPSRRQGSTPDIPRPRYVTADVPEYSRTFGVVVDTSGSMNAEMIGYALGAIASYSAAKEVPYARVVFCDADAYDAGYLAPDDIAGRVEVRGRGGTILQPGVDLLQEAKDFPKDAPILIITDGMIEDDLHVKREHAFLIPVGARLPFRAKGEVFRFSK